MEHCTSVIGKIMNALADRGEIEPVTLTWPGTDLEPVACSSAWAATDYLRDHGFYGLGAPLHEFA